MPSSTSIATIGLDAHGKVLVEIPSYGHRLPRNFALSNTARGSNQGGSVFAVIAPYVHDNVEDIDNAR